MKAIKVNERNSEDPNKAYAALTMIEELPLDEGEKILESDPSLSSGD